MKFLPDIQYKYIFFHFKTTAPVLSLQALAKILPSSFFCYEPSFYIERTQQESSQSLLFLRLHSPSSPSLLITCVSPHFPGLSYKEAASLLFRIPRVLKLDDITCLVTLSENNQNWTIWPEKFQSKWRSPFFLKTLRSGNQLMQGF